MTSRRHKLLAGLGYVFLGFLVLVLIWNWDWLRPLVEVEASAGLGRKVTLSHFDVHPSLDPLLIADGIEIANPPEFPQGSRFGSIRHLAVRIDLPALLAGHIKLTEIVIDDPQGDLRPGPSGKPNWRFGTNSTSHSSSPGELPEIGDIQITNGVFHVVDPTHKAIFTLTIETPPATDREKSIVVDIKGTYGGAPIVGRLVGGSVLSLRDPRHPYPINLTLANGATRVVLIGTIEHPLAFAGAHLDLKLQGDDLSHLYPLTGIPFAPTPPYRLDGLLDYAQGRIRFRDFHGTVGSSDLSGELDVTPGKQLPLVTATLTSQRVVLADLGGFIGSTPGSVHEANETAQQRREHESQAANPNLLPDNPISLPKIHAANIELTYHGEHIIGTRAPLDDLSAVLSIENGKITLHPLQFGIGQGRIQANIALDGSQNPIHTIADIDFRQIDLHRLLEATKIFHGAGIIGGQARIDTSGNSLAKMLAHGNGGLDLFMSGPGNMSALLIDLSGLEFGNSLFSALGLPDQTDIRCAVLQSDLDQGLLRTKTLLLDTTAANVVGTGTVDFRDQSIDYQITTTSKHFSIGSLPAPIDVNGPLKHPTVIPDPKTVAVRGAAAAALGVLLTPLGALIPTIELGLGKDNDCKALLTDTEQAARTQGRGDTPHP